VSKSPSTGRPRCTPTSTLLLIAVFCAADDLLPERPGNARRRVTDAEVVTLCVAQAVMGIPSDRRFLALAASGPGTYSRSCPSSRGPQTAPPAVGDDRLALRRLRSGEP
jgi:hypothetical protein